MRIDIHSERGLTFVEVIVMLVGTVVLVAALVPSMAAVVQDTRRTRATSDMQNIRDAILTCLSDMNFNYFTTDGVKTGPKVELLLGDGDIPRENTGSAPWQQTVNNGDRDFLERHLVTNRPGGSVLNDYPSSGGANYWRGAYLTGPVDPDPWGNRYAVNVEWLAVTAPDVIALSAGSNEVIETTDGDDGQTAGGDDIVVLVQN